MQKAAKLDRNSSLNDSMFFGKSSNSKKRADSMQTVERLTLGQIGIKGQADKESHSLVINSKSEENSNGSYNIKSRNPSLAKVVESDKSSSSKGSGHFESSTKFNRRFSNQTFHPTVFSEN